MIHIYTVYDHTSNEYETYRDIKTVYCIHREFYGLIAI